MKNCDISKIQHQTIKTNTLKIIIYLFNLDFKNKHVAHMYVAHIIKSI